MTRPESCDRGSTLSTGASLSIAIPTYGREQVLLDTLAGVLALDPPAAEVLVLDQTELHSPAVTERLAALDLAGRIRHIRLPSPSIPTAMNAGLALARSDLVLFLDDDIRPEPELVAAHVRAHAMTGAALVAGRVLQPWHEGEDFSGGGDFHFAATNSAWIDAFMGGNFSIRREVALDLGGFDENFVRVAYNFEAEFAHRFRRAHGRIYFEPAACIHHLKISSGGTRSFGEHLRTARPDHAVGAYYCLLRSWRGIRTMQAMLWRPIRSIATRHHLQHPWWIPLTLIGEFRGLVWALLLAARGPRYVGSARKLR